MDAPSPSIVRIGWAVFICAVALVLLRLASAVFVPLALALFTVALAWPLQRRLERWRTPAPLAYLLTLFAVLLTVGVFIGLLYACARNIAEKAPDYRERFTELHQNAKDWISEQRRKTAPLTDLDGDGPEPAARPDPQADVDSAPPAPSASTDSASTAESAAKAPGASSPPAGAETGQGSGGDTLVTFAGKVLAFAYGLVGQLALLVTFTVLILIEVRRFTQKLERRLPAPLGTTARDVCSEISGTLQRYMLLRTLVSATTGVLVWLFTWLIGLEFPLVWGVTSFLLNYIPTLGSIVAVIPPTLFAALDGDTGLFFTTFAGLTVIQFTIGNLLDPRLEGRVLRLSPALLFLSMVFWGWLWGVPGALLGIPILSAIFIVCRRFEATRPLADLLEK
jgi:predicted PurR-regulated permease PerM